MVSGSPAAGEADTEADGDADGVAGALAEALGAVDGLGAGLREALGGTLALGCGLADEHAATSTRAAMRPTRLPSTGDQSSPSSDPSAGLVDTPGESPMRIALLGAGRIGRLHGGLLTAENDVEVVVADVDVARATETASAIGGRAAGTIDDAMDGADAVIVATSTDSHAALVRAAIDRRLPVFCEKPLAFTLEETVALADLIDARGATVQVGFQRRFDPAYREARRLVESGELGTVYLVRLIAHDHEVPSESYIPTSGGLFRDSSIHDFDALRWATGQEVVEVYATGSTHGLPVFERYDDIGIGAAILTLADGTLGVLSQTRHDPIGYDIRMEVVGSKDSVAVGLGRQTPIRSLEPDAPVLADPPWTTWLRRFEPAYREELRTFLRVARGEVPVPCTARDALAAMRIAVAAGRSRTEGRPVRIEDVRVTPVA
jgi:myo-inositol 2-dehydrogenase / D-chiro-inositol 1-dehydrogenase